jgi:predicted nucleotidyltransferase
MAENAPARHKTRNARRTERLINPSNCAILGLQDAATMKRQKKNGLTRQGILRALRQNRGLLAKYAVRKIALFGSYAKGQQTEKSDIDFLVEFTRPTYDNLLGLSKALERLFGRKVEILTPEGLDSIRVKDIADDIREALVYG